MKERPLFTRVDFPPFTSRIEPGESALLIGSCFATRIAPSFLFSGLDIVTNPAGIQYNPEPMARYLNRLLDNRAYIFDDLLSYEGLYFSPDHHGTFSGEEPEQILEKINNEFEKARRLLLAPSATLVLTPGTAKLYRLIGPGVSVANCHRLPSGLFETSILKPERIVQLLSEPLSRLQMMNPECRIILSVSPVRYLREGAIPGSSSKANLLSAIHELHNILDRTIYFPSFEILHDELRDYRFYGSDMAHPSDLAVEIIVERFLKAALSSRGIEILEESMKIHEMLNHRPGKPGSERYGEFLQKLRTRIENHSSGISEVLHADFLDRLGELEKLV